MTMHLLFVLLTAKRVAQKTEINNKREVFRFGVVLHIVDILQDRMFTLTKFLYYFRRQ
jgi:hypothetical protein